MVFVFLYISKKYFIKSNCMALNNRNNNNLVLSETNSLYKWIVKLPFREWKRRPQPVKANAAAILVWPWLSRKVGACARMGRVQGGARAAFAKVCKMSVAGGCLQTLMTECSHGRRRRQLWAGAPPARRTLWTLKKTLGCLGKKIVFFKFWHKTVIFLFVFLFAKIQKK